MTKNWEAVKLEVFNRDRWRCRYCGYDGSKSFEAWLRGGFHCDHLRPRSEGGEDTVENCVTACTPCNLAKGDKWFSTLEAAQHWLRLYREEQARPWFEHHVINAGPINGWNRNVWGPTWERLKQLYKDVEVVR
jgi:5-methylcytosine-specific restriction endonuclease McrA